MRREILTEILLSFPGLGLHQDPLPHSIIHPPMMKIEDIRMKRGLILCVQSRKGIVLWRSSRASKISNNETADLC